MNYWWVRIISWHAVRPSRALETRTICGRTAPIGADTSETLPLSEKSCETCARLILKAQGETS